MFGRSRQSQTTSLCTSMYEHKHRAHSPSQFGTKLNVKSKQTSTWKFSHHCVKLGKQNSSFQQMAEIEVEIYHT